MSKQNGGVQRDQDLGAITPGRVMARLSVQPTSAEALATRAVESYALSDQEAR